MVQIKLSVVYIFAVASIAAVALPTGGGSRFDGNLFFFCLSRCAAVAHQFVYSSAGVDAQPAGEHTGKNEGQKRTAKGWFKNVVNLNKFKMKRNPDVPVTVPDAQPEAPVCAHCSKKVDRRLSFPDSVGPVVDVPSERGPPSLSEVGLKHPVNFENSLYKDFPIDHPKPE